MVKPNYEAQGARLWAKSVSIPAPDRGRVPKAIMNRFHALDEETQAGYVRLAQNGPGSGIQARDAAVEALGETITATQRVYQPEPEEEPEWVKRGRELATAKALDRVTRAQQLCEMALI